MSRFLTLFAKRVLFLVLLALLLVPALQAKFKWVNTGELYGYFEGPTPHPELTWEALKANTFQPRLERYLDDRIGFREWFIKLRNQLAYSVFYETNDASLFRGRNENLFDARMLNAYIGLNAVDAAAVQRHIRHLRVVQDTLARRGKLLVFVAAASKASFAPEDMPPYFRQYPRRRSNYENYTAAMRAAGINLLDLSHAFRQWKDTASYPLFPRNGSHWSNYGAALAGDTIMRYVQHKYGHPLRSYRLRAGEVSTLARDSDNDIADPLNLWYPVKPQLMKYPTVEFEPLQAGQRRPSALFIGDSFVFTVLYTFFQHAFDDQNSRFWFYNIYNQIIVWPGNRPEGTDMNVIDRKAQYLARDIILVMFTEYNMDHRLDYGFSDDAYSQFVPYSRQDSLRIQALEREILQQPGVEDSLWRKANTAGVSVEQEVHRQAVARYNALRD